jgi:hypothetical protein
MPASNDMRMGEDSPTPEVLHGTDFATPTPITFTTPPPGLTLAERTQRAIAEFDVVLDSYLDVCYQPMWKGLQALVSQLAEQTAQQQQNAEILEQQRREQREQSATQEDRLERVETLLNKLLSKPPSPPPTYAAALRTGLAPPPDRDVPTRLTREILVQRSNTTEGLHPETLVRRVNNAKKISILGKVIAARRLPSGDIVLTTDSVDTKRQLEAETTWLQALGEGSQLNRRKFPVLVHSVSLKDFDAKQQEQTIKRIYDSDHRLRQAKVEILRVHWPRRSLRAGRTRGALIIDTASPEQANWLVDEGLLWRSELMQCELFHGACNITQCFKCQKYGHTAKHCRSQQRCGYCAGFAHSDSECDIRGKGGTPICVACDGKHTAWNRSCPERRKQWERARLVYATRPRRFNCSTPKATIQPPRAVSPSKRARRDSSPAESTISSSMPPPSTMPPSSTMPPPSAPTEPTRWGPGRPRNRPTPGPRDQSLETWFPRGALQDGLGDNF